MKWYMERLENFYIRILWILKASSVKFKVGCPPACSEGHTFKWPCKNRIRPVKEVKRYRHYDPKGEY